MEYTKLGQTGKEKAQHNPNAPGVGEYLLTAYDIHAHD